MMIWCVVLASGPLWMARWTRQTQTGQTIEAPDPNQLHESSQPSLTDVYETTVVLDALHGTACGLFLLLL